MNEKEGKKENFWNSFIKNWLQSQNQSLEMSKDDLENFRSYKILRSNFHITA
jgi:hypothetical protein